MRAIKIVVFVALLAVAFAAGLLVRVTRESAVRSASGARRVLYYVDPMHPAYRSDKPGIAPDCGMALEPVYADEPVTTAAAPRTVRYYRDPKDHAYHANVPGLNPETGNTLEPVYEETAAPAAGSVRIAPERQQLAGVRFTTVTAEAGTRTVRTVGQVTFDETRIAHVHTRFEGWIEKVYVDFTGDVVRQGQPMLTVYSPEMLASQQELLLAARAREAMKDNALSSAAEHGQSLFAAARRRLELWSLSDEQIDEVLRTGTPIRSVPVPAPTSGFITARNAFPNQRVTPDSDLYTIADLSHVWVLADVFEADMNAVRIGGGARVGLPSTPGHSLSAHVNYVQPQIDPTTRTLKVRLDVANPGMRLKPNMYVDVDFVLPQPSRLVVPASAVLDSGGHQTVFVDRGNGYLEPRPISIGERMGDRVAVLSGLAAGDRIVASGMFLVDSESQLRAAAAGMGAPTGHGDHAGAAATPPATGTAAPAPEPHHD